MLYPFDLDGFDPARKQALRISASNFEQERA
jgi:hypothetical protein